MEKLKPLSKKANEVKEKYSKLNKKRWSVAEYAQGLIGDVGDLVKLIMAKKGFRKIEDVDQKLAHELADCLWSVLVIADELGINLEKEFIKNMDKLNKKLAVINKNGKI